MRATNFKDMRENERERERKRVVKAFCFFFILSRSLSVCLSVFLSFRFGHFTSFQLGWWKFFEHFSIDKTVTAYSISDFPLSWLLSTSFSSSSSSSLITSFNFKNKIVLSDYNIHRILSKNNKIETNKHLFIGNT